MVVAPAVDRQEAQGKALRAARARLGHRAPCAGVNSLAYRVLFGGDVTTEISFMLPGFRWEVVENAEGAALHADVPHAGERELHAHHAGDVLEERAAARCDQADPHSGRARIPRSGRPHGRSAEQGLQYSPSMLWIDDIDVQAKWYLKLKREWTKSREEKRDFVNPIEPTTLRWMS